MRSVVVVLPASICAMIPMLRVLASSALLAIFPSSFRVCGLAGFWIAELPAVVGESLVRFGHLVGVLASLDAGTETVAGVQQLVHQALGHGLLTTGAGVADQPAQRQRGLARHANLYRNLVGRATDAAATHLEGR